MEKQRDRVFAQLKMIGQQGWVGIPFSSTGSNNRVQNINPCALNIYDHTAKCQAHLRQRLLRVGRIQRRPRAV